MSLRYSQQALRDLREIRDFYRSESSRAAGRVSREILRALELIHRRPAIGIRSAPDKRIRSKLLVRYPYRIYYRLMAGGVIILHIRHTARRPWPGEDQP
ncbi:MAG: type II toxin-antitoxin system RelE/ParE family toxin [Bauldia sp.]